MTYSLVLPPPATGTTLRIDIDDNGWARLVLLAKTERRLGADTAFNLLSRLLAALSEPAQPVTEIGSVSATCVLSLWEDHHTIWIERHGGGPLTLHIQEDVPGVSMVASINMDRYESVAWRGPLIELLAEVNAEGLTR